MHIKIKKINIEEIIFIKANHTHTSDNKEKDTPWHCFEMPLTRQYIRKLSFIHSLTIYNLTAAIGNSEA